MADGKVLIDAQIDTSDVTKGINEIRKELNTKIRADAFKDLNTAFKASVAELKAFKASIAEMSEDGIFRYSELTKEQRIMYDDMVKGTQNIEKQMKSIEEGITLADKSARRLRATLLSMGITALIALAFELSEKFWEWGKAALGFEDAAKKVDRQLTIMTSKTIPEQEKELQNLEEQYNSLSEVVLAKAEIMETMGFGVERKKAIEDMAAAIWAQNQDMWIANGLTQESFIRVVSSEEDFQKAIDLTKDSVDRLRKSLEDQGVVLDKHQGAFALLEERTKKARQAMLDLLAAENSSPQQLNESITQWQMYEDKLEEVNSKLLELKGTTIDLAPAMASFISEGVLNFEQMASYVEQGSTTWEAAAATILDSLATMVEGIGQQTIAAGIAKQAVEVLPGGAAISAGLGIILLGKLIKVMAAQQKKSFSHYASGGIVQGSLFDGDNIPANLTAGEIVLNAAQQDNVADALGGTSPNLNIIINNNSEASVGVTSDEQDNTIIDIIDQRIGKLAPRIVDSQIQGKYGLKSRGI